MPKTLKNFRLSPEVVAALERQSNQTATVEKALRAELGLSSPAQTARVTKARRPIDATPAPNADAAFLRRVNELARTLPRTTAEKIARQELSR